MQATLTLVASASLMLRRLNGSGLNRGGARPSSTVYIPVPGFTCQLDGLNPTHISELKICHVLSPNDLSMHRDSSSRALGYMISDQGDQRQGCSHASASVLPESEGLLRHVRLMCTKSVVHGVAFLLARVLGPHRTGQHKCAACLRCGFSQSPPNLLRSRRSPR